MGTWKASEAVSSVVLDEKRKLLNKAQADGCSVHRSSNLAENPTIRNHQGMFLSGSRLVVTTNGSL
jgi:hypothetical protein